MDDAALVEAVKRGGTERFAELVDRHSGAVFRLVRAAIRNPDDAEDLAQDAFVAAFGSLRRLRDPSRFRPYLLAIASRRVIDYIRRNKRRGHMLPLEHEPAAPAPDERQDLLEAVERVAATLPPEARLVFALRHHEGLSCIQIARMLELPAGTVYSRLARIHKAIRRALEVTE